MPIEKQVNINVTQKGTEKAIAQTQKLNDKLVQLDKSTGALTTGLKSNGNAILENGGAMGLLNDATGGYAMMAKDAVEATALFAKGTTLASVAQKAYAFVIGTTTGALKALRIALAASGIGLIVVALGFLIEKLMSAKSSTDLYAEAQDKLNKELAEYNNQIQRSLQNLDFQEKASVLRAKIAGKSEKEIFDLTQGYSKRKNEVLLADLRKTEADEKHFRETLIKVKKEGTDEEIKIFEDLYNKSVEARKKANDALINADKDGKLKILENNLSDADKQRELEKQTNDKNAQLRKEHLEKLAKLKEEQDKKDAEYQASLIQGRNDLQIATNEAEFNQRQLDLENKQRQLDDLKLLDENLTKAEKEESDKRILQAKYEAEQKKVIQDGIINLASGAVGLLNAIAGKNKAIQKAGIIAENAIGIGKMIIANNQANIGALATPQAIATSGASATPVIAFNNISTGIAIASTLVATAKALKAVGGGSADGGKAGGGAGAPSAPSFNIVQGTNTNQIARNINTERPIQAFVVSKNVTTAQEMDRNIVQNASWQG